MLTSVLPNLLKIHLNEKKCMLNPTLHERKHMFI